MEGLEKEKEIALYLSLAANQLTTDVTFQPFHAEAASGFALLTK